MSPIERRIAREAKAVTREEVIIKALEQRITWGQAAEILGITDRHLRRIRHMVEKCGMNVLVDRRGLTRRRRRVPAKTIEELCRLRRERYGDFSIRHFYEFATEKHGLKLSYTLTRSVLQAAGLAEKAPGRGKYRRKRERRPMTGMLLHLDGSTHTWIAGLPQQDLVVMLDDADGRILFARFFEQEGNFSTFAALEHVLTKFGRFCELYTDRGSHFCTTVVAGEDPTLGGQVPRALRALGIRQILARSPEARGRSERCFGTIQGRLPQELRLAGIRSYEGANGYLPTFVASFNRRFAVRPAQTESAFTPLAGVDLPLLLSNQHARTVRNDNTVMFGQLVLQLEPGKGRLHYARCPVVVHELLNGTLAVTYQGSLLETFDRQGEVLKQRRRVA
jgi:hypothetical protein